jgi:HSP20 family protein
MNVIHWDRFGDVNTLFRLLPGSYASRSPVPAEATAARTVDWAPIADIGETTTEYVIRVELPAVAKDDVKVTLDQGVITIAGERKSVSNSKDEKMHRVESMVGKFERSFSLPEDVNAATVTCTTKDGILTVHIPKKEKPKHTPTQITVQ